LNQDFLKVSNRLFIAIASLIVLFARGQSGEVTLTFEKKFPIAKTSIRAIELDDANNLWFAGSNGIFGRIQGETLQIDSLEYQGKNPSFRSLAIRENTAFALSIENPALLYRLPVPTSGQKAELIYIEEHPNIFYDSMAFLDSDVGIAMGDPIEGCLSILITKDGGRSWRKKPCSELPSAFQGEAAFAASDTNIATMGNSIWIGSGGKKARVFVSADRGESWNVYDTPIIQGQDMTGIYTLDFADQLNGIAMGGNWENKQSTVNAKAITRDGGKTWHLVGNHALPGYISCVKYIPGSGGHELLACSTEGIFYSRDKGNTWNQLSEQGYYSLRFQDKGTIWMSRNNEIAKFTLKRH
jgi:photosystem II stability/assembly factor-like uncharacterized protein